MTLNEREELENKYNHYQTQNSKDYYKFVSENKGDLLKIFGPNSPEYKSIILVPNKVEESVIAKDEARRIANNNLMQQDSKLKGAGVKAVDQSAKELLKNQDDTADKLNLVKKIISNDKSLVTNKVAAEEADKLLKDLGISKDDTASLNLFVKDLQKSVDRSKRIRDKWNKMPKALQVGAQFLIPRMADKWEQGYDSDITDKLLDAGEIALGPIIGGASKGIKAIPKATEILKNIVKLRDKGSDFLKAKSAGVPYVGEIIEKGSKGIGTNVAAQLGMMGVDDVVYENTPLNRGNYSVGDYLTAGGMGTFINSIGKKGITQRDRNQLDKIDEAIDKYSVYPKRLNEPGKVNLKNKKVDDEMRGYFQEMRKKDFIDNSLNKSSEDFISNYTDKVNINKNTADAMRTVLTQVPEEEIMKYAKKNNITKNEALRDITYEYMDFIKDRRNTLLDEKVKLPKFADDIDEIITDGTYFNQKDVDNVQQITKNLKNLKNAKEMSLFEKNLNMLPTMGGYYLTEVADRAGILNKGEYKVPEDQFEQREIKKSDLQRLYNDVLAKYKNKGWSIEDSAKWTPEERYIIENIRK